MAYKNRHRKRNRHHMQPKSRGGTRHPSNMLLLKIERHDAWHTLFGIKTLDEVIELLSRIRNAKRGDAK